MARVGDAPRIGIFTSAYASIAHVRSITSLSAINWLRPQPSKDADCPAQRTAPTFQIARGVLYTVLIVLPSVSIGICLASNHVGTALSMIILPALLVILLGQHDHAAPRTWLRGKLGHFMHRLEAVAVIETAPDALKSQTSGSMVCVHPHGWYPLVFLWGASSQHPVLRSAPFVGETSALILPFIAIIHLLRGLFLSASSCAIAAFFDRRRAVCEQAVVVMMPGGIDETMECTPLGGTTYISAAQQGFLRLAFNGGYAVIPAYAFGVDDAVASAYGPLQRYAWRAFRMVLPPLLFPTSAAWVPTPRALVIGPAITPAAYDTFEGFADTYYAQVSALFHDHKGAYGADSSSMRIGKGPPRMLLPLGNVGVLVGTLFVGFQSARLALAYPLLGLVQGVILTKTPMLVVHMLAGAAWQFGALFQEGLLRRKSVRGMLLSHRAIGAALLVAHALFYVTGVIQQLVFTEYPSPQDAMGVVAWSAHSIGNLFIGNLAVSYAASGIRSARVCDWRSHGVFMKRSYLTTSTAITGRFSNVALRTAGLSNELSLIIGFSANVTLLVILGSKSRDPAVRRKVVRSILMAAGSVLLCSRLDTTVVSCITIGMQYFVFAGIVCGLSKGKSE